MNSNLSRYVSCIMCNKKTVRKAAIIRGGCCPRCNGAMKTLNQGIYTKVKQKTILCKLCKKKLVPIKGDWKGRKYHNKCWTELQTIGYAPR